MRLLACWAALVLSLGTVLNQVRADGVIDGVQCETTELSYKFANTTVKNRVCKPGTLKLSNYHVAAFAAQDVVARGISVCDATFFGTHNSNINQAAGFGSWDALLSDGIGKALKDPTISQQLSQLLRLPISSFLPSDFLVQTSNQAFSVVDQLRMGSRFLEIDLHDVDGKIRQGHCNFMSQERLDIIRTQLAPLLPSVTNILKNANKDAADIFQSYIVKALLEPQGNVTLIGCKPGLSGVPTDKQPEARDVFDDINAFLKTKGYNETVLHIYINSGGAGETMKKIRDILKDKMEKIAFTPEQFVRDYGSNWARVTSDRLLAAGKRVFFTTNVDLASVAPDVASFMFMTTSPNPTINNSTGTFCQGWREYRERNQLSPFPTCAVLDGATIIRANTRLEQRGVLRFYNSHIHFGPLDENLSLRAANETAMQQLLNDARDCYNIVSWDDMTPNGARSMIWTWTDNEPQALGDAKREVCACMMKSTNGRWKACPCDERNVPVACRSQESGQWTTAIDSCPPGTLWAVPRTPYENRVLAFVSNGLEKIRLNYRTLPVTPGDAPGVNNATFLQAWSGAMTFVIMALMAWLAFAAI